MEVTMDVKEQNGVYCYAIYGPSDGVNIGALRQYIVDSVDVLSFWNHLPFLYLIKTKVDLNTITHKLAPFYSGKFFIVMAIDPDNVNGILPMTAWEWFRTPPPPTKLASPFSSPQRTLSWE
jgi:hypothetical protein